MTTLALGGFGNFQIPQKNTGSSECSNKIDHMIRDAYEHLSQPISRQTINLLYDELEEISTECSSPNWDGYGAAPIKLKAIDDVLGFLKSMPKWLPLPMIAPEPSGDVGLQWNVAKGKIFAISFNGNNLITYAGLLGANNKISGTEAYSDSIPHIIIESLKRITG